MEAPVWPGMRLRFSPFFSPITGLGNTTDGCEIPPDRPVFGENVVCLENPTPNQETIELVRLQLKNDKNAKLKLSKPMTKKHRSKRSKT